MIQAYLPLVVAILLELAGTSFLQASQQFTRPLQTGLMVAAYIGSFYCLSLALRVLPVSIAYATWSGLGIVLIAVIGYVVFRQSLDWPAIAGIALIVIGVVIVNGFSKTVGH
ncbi:QacE family quaternary ammonium compound efflux SMR transporter [Zavarzinia compransoris]|uniref:QacE family quaternary ammonium compound efflux SMR transporter n=1 Tax=Zavarzinia compransoris TaxID=1264899 RepID=A0A317E857_9PROT|nr:QacE family quaternary ammonium compound efflux SMR transporter [Zavarzinia compransoris]